MNAEELFKEIVTAGHIATALLIIAVTLMYIAFIKDTPKSGDSGSKSQLRHTK